MDEHCEYCDGTGIEPHPEDPNYDEPNPSPEWDPQPPRCRECYKRDTEAMWASLDRLMGWWT